MTEHQDQTPEQDQNKPDESKLVAERRRKLAELREATQAAGGTAFPNDFRRDSVAEQVHAMYGKRSAESLAESEPRVAMAGRLMSRRVMGKASFADLQDGTGRIQLFVRKNELGEDAYAAFKGWDVGDQIAVTGKVFITKAGELSVWADEIRLLTKSLRPLPEKWAGLTDTEKRYRQRYVDLVMNPDVRNVFRKRTQVIQFIRQFMDTLGFMEVETPMMHPLAGGAAAKPFVTHYNVMDRDYFLRIAPELYLKRRVVGGFERAYEIQR
ncbi:lysine--tRNA ligase, partial [bacterium]|nr:lysine--tRNA ligase [bacterium]